MLHVGRATGGANSLFRLITHALLYPHLMNTHGCFRRSPPACDAEGQIQESVCICQLYKSTSSFLSLAQTSAHMYVLSSPTIL